MGFEGEAFLNACLEVRSNLSAELLLSKLLQIEEKYGRKRYEDGQYRARPHALDRLFFGDQSI